MAKKVKRETKSYEPSLSETKQAVDAWKKGYDYYQPIRSEFDEKEALVLCKLEDSISKSSAKSQVIDPRLLTIIMERTFRVMSQLPSGKVKALTKQNVGKSLFMDVILNKYIVPNANTQYDILTKHRLVNFYSHIYGSFPALVDWVVKDDYVGPDYYMIPVRDFVPQPGKFSINDCDYSFIATRVSKKWLKSRTVDSWKNIDKLLSVAKGKTQVNARNYERQSYAEQTYSSEYTESNDDAMPIELVTKYTHDRWFTFAPEYPDIPALRDIENPHYNDKLPIVVKESFPLLDRFYGLGEMEKGMSLQLAINSLINLYLDGVKYSIFPPMKVDPMSVVTSTLKIEPGAKWLMKNGNMNGVMSHDISPQGMNTFQNTYQFMIAALLNQAGTTDTTVSDVTDPGMGKTPAAVNFLAQRQNARDAYDRFMQEKFIEDVYDRFTDLISVKQEKPINLDLFDAEFEQIKKYNPDLLDMFESKDGGSVVIKPNDIKNTKYKFHIDAGSTYKKEEAMEKAELEAKMAMVMQLPQAPEQIAQTGGVFIGKNFIDFAEMFKRSVITAGVQDWERIVRPAEEVMAELGGEGMPQGEVPQEDPAQLQIDQEMEAIMQELQTQQAPQGQPMPQQAPQGYEQGY